MCPTPNTLHYAHTNNIQYNTTELNNIQSGNKKQKRIFNEIPRPGNIAIELSWLNCVKRELEIYLKTR